MSDNGPQINLTIHQDNAEELFKDLLIRSSLGVYGEVDPTYDNRINIHRVSHRVIPISIKENVITFYIDIINNEHGQRLLKSNESVSIVPKFITDENNYITQILTIDFKTAKDESN